MHIGEIVGIIVGIAVVYWLVEDIVRRHKK